MSLIEFKNVTKSYGTAGQEFKALDSVSFSIDAGEYVVILGPSGAGKSTLLNLLGGMDRATSGDIAVSGIKVNGLSDDALSQYRAENVGFVFQFYNLIPTLTAAENIALVKSIVKNPIGVQTALDMVGLLPHADQFPAQLSGGEQQRVSIARAVAKNPAVLLCDEPTGALDSQTGTTVLQMLRKMSREGNKTVIIVTHNSILAETADRVIRLKNGRIHEITVNAAPKDISEVSW